MKVSLYVEVDKEDETLCSEDCPFLVSNIIHRVPENYYGIFQHDTHYCLFFNHTYLGETRQRCEACVYITNR